MTVLYRCRTALSEVARHFDAQYSGPAHWSAEVWKGRAGLIVTQDQDARQVRVGRWGMPSLDRPFYSRLPDSVTTLLFRDVCPDNKQWLDKARRCLIVADSFAQPDRSSAQATRTWLGYEDQSIFGWAGICNPTTDTFCGFLVAANECVAPRPLMPAIVAADAINCWFGNDLAAAARLTGTTPSERGMYREPTEQPWNDGPQPSSSLLSRPPRL